MKSKKIDKDELLSKKAKQLLTVGSISVFLLLLAYSLKFGLRLERISGESSDWGSFGSYIGGLLGPIIGGLNLVFLIYINNKLLKENRKLSQMERNESDLRFNKTVAFEKKEKIAKHIFSLRDLIVKNTIPSGENRSIRWDIREKEKFKSDIENIFVYTYSYFNNDSFTYFRAFLELLSETLYSEEYKETQELVIPKDIYSKIIRKLTYFPVQISSYSIYNNLSPEMETSLETEVSSKRKCIELFNNLRWTTVEYISQNRLPPE